jgi:hypothetical protein
MQAAGMAARSIGPDFLYPLAIVKGVVQCHLPTVQLY